MQWLKDNHDLLMEKEKKVEQQNIDPELEYDITHEREKNEQARNEKEGINNNNDAKPA